MTWAKTETKVSTDEESEELPRSRRMQGGAPAYYDSLLSYYLFIF